MNSENINKGETTFLFVSPVIIFTFLVFVSSAIELDAQNTSGEQEPKLSSWVIGSKKEIVFVLHGGPCVEHSYLRPEFDKLTKVSKVIYYDQRGCGQSDLASNYIWQKHVDDLSTLIDSFAGDRRVYLAGSSWGSALALLYAYCHPEDLKGLILSGLFKWEGRGMDSLAFEMKYRDKLERLSPPTLKKNYLNKVLVGDTILGSGKKVKKYYEVRKAAFQNYGRPSLETLRSLVTAPVFEDLAVIKTPKIIFNGTRNCHWVREVNKYREIFTPAPYIEIDGACHDPWYHNPDEFFQYAIEFIRETKQGRKRKILRYEKHKSDLF